MQAVSDIWRRGVMGALLAAVLLGLLVPSSASAARPEIAFAYANTENGDVRFTVKALIDAPRRVRSVRVTFRGVTAKATELRDPRTLYQSAPYAAPVRKCYGITVIASDGRRTTTQRVRAGHVGTNGCRRR